MENKNQDCNNLEGGKIDSLSFFTQETVSLSDNILGEKSFALFFDASLEGVAKMVASDCTFLQEGVPIYSAKTLGLLEGASDFTFVKGVSFKTENGVYFTADDKREMTSVSSILGERFTKVVFPTNNTTKEEKFYMIKSLFKTQPFRVPRNLPDTIREVRLSKDSVKYFDLRFNEWKEKRLSPLS